MDLRNCPRCGALFAYLSSPICDKCVKEEDELFTKVRDYVKENPNCSALKVSEETGVPLRKIYSYLRDSKIDIASTDGIDLRCDKCGRHIATGKYCNNCAAKISQDAMAAFGKKINQLPEIKTNDRNPRMHTYRNKDN